MPAIPRIATSAPITWMAALPVLAIRLRAQTGDQKKLNLGAGKDVFLPAAGVGCHRPDGKGAADTNGSFKKPDGFPDFPDCKGAKPELADWKATFHDGGLARGFSRIMLSFSGALCLRGFCTENSSPCGKAFPESEAVMTMTGSRWNTYHAAEPRRFNGYYDAKGPATTASPEQANRSQ